MADKPADIIAGLQQGRVFSLRDLTRLWNDRVQNEWKTSPSIYPALARKALKMGEPLLACDIVTEAKEISDDPDVLKLYAQALIQLGAIQSAQDVLGRLFESRPDDFSILTMLARTNKDIGLIDPQNKFDYLPRSYRLYDQAFQQAVHEGNLDNQFYAGINLATLALLMGDGAKAAALADNVEEICKRHIAAGGQISYWVYATLAEAALVKKNTAGALDSYQKAVAMAREEIVSVISMKRQAHLLAHHLSMDFAPFDQVFYLPNVGCITGHMIDGPERKNSRFSEAMVPQVRRNITREIDENRIEIGFCSAANGADLIFADEMLKRSFEVNVILPFPPAAFKITSVASHSSPFWSDKFDEVMKKASRVILLNDAKPTDERMAFAYCGQVLDGLAAMRAHAIGSKLLNLAVWDQTPNGDIGGTAETIRRWQKSGYNVRIIPTKNTLKPTMTKDHPRHAQRSDSRQGKSTEGQPQKIVAILFADTINYSKLTDDIIPIYVDKFMALIPDQLNAMNLTNVYRNTWGDAFFLVFEDMGTAARFGLNLCESISSIDWAAHGLPANLNLRVAIHAGPAYFLEDRVTGLMNYFGYHVSKGARIEPITPAGHVYCSEQFASLATCDGCNDLEFDYVGKVSLAKNWGTSILYHVRRRPR